jgi:hypothetical protein
MFILIGPAHKGRGLPNVLTDKMVNLKLSLCLYLALGHTRGDSQVEKGRGICLLAEAVLGPLCVISLPRGPLQQQLAPGVCHLRCHPGLSGELCSGMGKARLAVKCRLIAMAMLYQLSRTQYFIPKVGTIFCAPSPPPICSLLLQTETMVRNAEDSLQTGECCVNLLGLGVP